ncbi:MAG: hypothetical protein KDC84_06955 [Crocinitomicaceae bacterium]|nr:hypothetical protein [Crocinitomicaceae bacterium]
MELDEGAISEKEWDNKKLKNIIIGSIVTSSIIIFLMLLLALFIGALRDLPEERLEELPKEYTLEELILFIRVGASIIIAVLAGSIVGGILMLKKNTAKAGWIVYLLFNVLIVLYMGFSILNGGGGLIPTLLFVGYLLFTVFAGKNRYKEEEKFENYSN